MRKLKKFREIVGKEEYANVIKDLQNKILEISALTPAALPHINNVLYDKNPNIVFDDNKTTGQIYFTSLSGFFTELEDTVKRAIGNNSLT